MKLLVDNEWLRQKIAEDPEMECEAGADPRELLAELEQELGVRGATAVFRKALALAKAARAEAANSES
jgi:hypothetical protein